MNMVTSYITINGSLVMVHDDIMTRFGLDNGQEVTWDFGRQVMVAHCELMIGICKAEIKKKKRAHLRVVI